MNVVRLNNRTFFSTQSSGKLSNRFVFCENSDTYIMTGDLPVVRLVKRRIVLGSIVFFCQTPEGEFLLHEAGSIQSLWRAGHSKWIIEDARIKGRIEIDAGNPEGEHGLVLKISAGENNVKLVYGGVHAFMPGNTDMSGVWSINPQYEGDYASIAMNPDHGGNERFLRVPGGFSITDPCLSLLDGRIAPKGAALSIELLADFSLNENGKRLTGSFCGEALASLTLCAQPHNSASPAEKFDKMLSRADQLSRRLCVSTPLPLLDMSCAYTSEYQNGIWYPPKTMHAPLSWNVPYLGWTNRYGTAALGWHSRIEQELTYYADRFTLSEENCDYTADFEAHMGTIPAKTSRFYGRGHIHEDQHMYNMQTQFFDQAIYSWRMTGSESMARLLYKALPLHMEWYDACFDRGGVYESVIDTWPTDSCWCAGGASSDATCYAYRAHEAIAELARIFGDEDRQTKHEALCRHIKEAFFRLLWIEDKGYPGKFREQGGLERLHENPWIYASFLPVDVNLLSPLQAAQTVHYARRTLENVPSGEGSLISGSNWVPSVWSVRWVGENEVYMQALAFFKAGFFDDGLRLQSGGVCAMNTLDSMRFLGSDGARCVVEGLFGYRPDYPNGNVLIAPGMPFAWKNASIQTADVSICYERGENHACLSGSLFKRARLTLRIPLYAKRAAEVRGAEEWHMEPGFGCAFVVITLPDALDFDVKIETCGTLAPLEAIEIDCAPGTRVCAPFSGEVLGIHDPQGVAQGCTASGNEASFLLNARSGEHMLFASVRHGDNTCIQCAYLAVSKTEAEILNEKRMHPVLPKAPVFEIVNAQSILHDDVQAIYRQKYLSPRPETISTRIGTDGYSPWTFTFWKNSPPEIQLQKRGSIHTHDGVPLFVAEGEKNIGFVSLWDNFPDSIDLPVGKKGKICVLMLAGTTNPMQCGVENARVSFRYADGSEEHLALRNPDEFWSLTELAAAPSAAGQNTNNDYSYETDAFCLPETPPENMQLGKNCRSIIVRWQLKENSTLEIIRLAALSQEVVIGLMSATIVR